MRSTDLSRALVVPTCIAAFTAACDDDATGPATPEAVPDLLVPIGTANIDGATVCNQNGNAYVTSTIPKVFRNEDQPVNVGFGVINSFTAGTAPAFTVGGAGLRPGTAPIWSVKSSTGATYTFAGRTTGSNCVANETSVRLPVTTQAGEVWQISVTYLAGNSGRLVQGQQHYQTSFVAAPPPPSPFDFCRLIPGLCR